MDPDFVDQVRCALFWLNRGLRVYLNFYIPDLKKKYIKVPIWPQYFFFSTTHPSLEAFYVRNVVSMCPVWDGCSFYVTSLVECCAGYINVSAAPWRLKPLHTLPFTAIHWSLKKLYPSLHSTEASTHSILHCISLKPQHTLPFTRELKQNITSLTITSPSLHHHFWPGLSLFPLNSPNLP